MNHSPPPPSSVLPTTRPAATTAASSSTMNLGDLVDAEADADDDDDESAAAAVASHSSTLRPAASDTTTASAACLCLEEVMFMLFTPPGIDSGPCNGGSSGSDDDVIRYNDDENDDDDMLLDDADISPAEVSMDSCASDDSSTIRRYCEIWKHKRREEKERAARHRRLRLQALENNKDINTANTTRIDNQSTNDEVAVTKQIALDIQRSFERKFDDTPNMQRSREKYGNRVLHRHRYNV